MLNLSYILFFFFRITTMAKTKVIIDCDPGTDDAQAILIALACSNIETVAITTVFGNSYIEHTTRNAVRLLKLCNRLDVSQLQGA
jgi:inosine-uridine nucleoside N-ribohydrolase